MPLTRRWMGQRGRGQDAFARAVRVGRAVGCGALLAMGAGTVSAQSGSRSLPGGAVLRMPPLYTRADTARLRARLDSLVAAHHGVVGYTVHNLDTGERLERRGDEPFSTASLIKVPILVTVYDLVAKGMLALDDVLTVLKIDMVP
ncbi:MAG: serine hydrolase, partial [Gemmatimonadaceae bacterium]|nr:serine hydrolase [Gemmatimonadaceae bacterium]